MHTLQAGITNEANLQAGNDGHLLVSLRGVLEDSYIY